ncbi:MAG TPA: SDR family oxidoreductase [Candidatus Limnocylindria bacterium]|nr:SDR family oxidoreductase [Candidatus Limnocylindria bacterium]
MAGASGGVLVTGGSGFLGSLVATTALRRSDGPIVLPIRRPEARDKVLARIAAEAAAEGEPLRDADRARLHIEPWPPPHGLGAMAARLARLGVRDILHCAGCLSYFNVAKLLDGNIELTRRMLELGARLDVRRFVFLSTAYCSGFTDALIPERLHEKPGEDPTDYTRTKRDAEWMVAESGLPWVIVRPSVVIGDSRDGRYGGKPYGIYQFWGALERYMVGAYPPVLHLVAARAPVNLLHQEAFVEGFWAAYRELPDGAVMHLASRDEGLPSMRDLTMLWFREYGGPRLVHLYERLDAVPMDTVAPPLRQWLEFTAVNSEIASVRWNFQRDRLEAMRERGLPFRDVSMETIAVVQNRFVRDSEKLREFVAQYRECGSPEPEIVVHDAA